MEDQGLAYLMDVTPMYKPHNIMGPSQASGPHGVCPKEHTKHLQSSFFKDQCRLCDLSPKITSGPTGQERCQKCKLSLGPFKGGSFMHF